MSEADIALPDMQIRGGLIDTTREQRVEVANEFLQIISEHGRRFFGDADHGTDRFELDERRRVWFLQRWNGARIYTHYHGRWRRFSHGGTLLVLVVSLRDYIMGRAELPTYALGPWPEWYCDGDLWGYGPDEMARVRERIDALRS